MINIKTTDTLRLIAVMLWFTGGLIDFMINYNVSALLSMLSAVSFGAAILMEVKWIS